MGLLLGSLVNDETEAYIQRSMVLSRKDKKKDRVEVSYADLALASNVADDLSMTIVGWYHSHPHITVLPSHVDVKTQGQYQVLGKFLGLIFSVFDKGQLEMCAFQSRQNRSGEWERVEVPVIVDHAAMNSSSSLHAEKRLLESLIAMQVVLMNEDRETLDNSFSKEKNKWSYLNITRPLAVHQTGLLRLIDLQICPLLLAMKSKILTLNYEKEKILLELKSLKSESTGQNNTASMMIINGMESTDDYKWKSVGNSVDNSEEHSAENLKECSAKALKALTKTIPKYARTIWALKIAFGGINCEIISCDGVDNGNNNGNKSTGTNVRKGELYTIKIKKMDISNVSTIWSGQDLGPASSPWILECTSYETETEDDVKKTSSQFPLFSVKSSYKPNYIEFTVLQSVRTSTNTDPKESLGPLQHNNKSLGSSKIPEYSIKDYRKVRITVNILSVLENAPEGSDLGEDMMIGLRLQLWPFQ